VRIPHKEHTVRVLAIRHQHVAFGNELLDFGVSHASFSEVVDVDVVPFEP